MKEEPGDAVLLIGFGGPTRPDEVRPFLDRVLCGHRVPRERVEEVVQHYELMGGKSPYNELTLRQAEALQQRLRETGLPLPVYTGMRHWHPLLADTLEQMSRDGVRHALALILTPHQGEASWGRCQSAASRALAEVEERLGTMPPVLTYAGPWFMHPGFVEAIAGRIQETLQYVPEGRRALLPLLFTAHSVPASMADPYVEQLLATCRAVAKRIAWKDWSLVYQSRSGDVGEAWLEPDVCDAIRNLADEGQRDVLLAPVGFICDHVEVLYDLDRQAGQVARKCGIGFFRAGTVSDHPSFIQCLADVVRQGATIR